MQVFIRSGPRVWSLPLGNVRTVDELKTEIYNLQGIPEKNQSLIFAGKKMETGHTLAEYGVSKDCLIHLVFPTPTHRTIQLNAPNRKTVAELQEIFPDVDEEAINSVVSAFSQLDKDGMAMYILLHLNERLDPKSAVRLILPDKDEKHVESAIARVGSDTNHGLYRALSQGTKEAILKEPVSDEVSILSVIEVDMHGMSYKPSEWSAPIRWTMDYSKMFGIDRVCFIPGKGLHTDSSQPIKLRPTVMATLATCGYRPYIDPFNNGCVWCDVNDTLDWRDVDKVQPEDGPELQEMAEEFPDFPKRVLQDLLIMGKHIMDDAKYLGHKLEDQLQAGIDNVVDAEEMERYQKIGEFLYFALMEFGKVPRPIIKRFGFDTAPDDERKRELRYAQEAIESGRIQAEDLEEMFKQAPNVPLRVLVDSLAGGNGADAVYAYLGMTMKKMDTKQQAFRFRLRLRGKRENGLERIQPVLYIDVVRASKEKAQRYIELSLERLRDREADWKKIFIHCPVLDSNKSGLEPKEAKRVVIAWARAYGMDVSVCDDGETVYVEVEDETETPKKDGAWRPKKDGAGKP